ncbi:MAG: toxic anion resistance protein [Oscillospiraceae bacterium]|jgi:uncharacterized protein YaaN involved in tellurite resistance
MDENNFTPYVPSLTLNPTGAAAAAEPAPQVTEEAELEKTELERLSPQEQAAVREFAEQIDINDTTQILNYGSASQKNIADFSGQALGKVRTKDLGEVGNMLTDLVSQLNGFDFEETEQKGIKRFFKKASRSIADMKTQYNKAEVNVDRIVEALENHWRVLTKDISTMDKMYEINQAYLKELTMYIIAGKLKLETLRANDLPALQTKARESGLPEDAQAANDFANLIGRFEKKIHDLELTRMISIQMSPQIRMIQNNDSIMCEKIQTSIVNTIPLWKSQMVLALSMHHSQQAMEAQRDVSKVTNDLLRKNAEALHMGSVEVAREAERGIVDLETLQHTNQELINTLNEVRQIQDDGRARRAEAEKELGRIETELKHTLLDMRG